MVIFDSGKDGQSAAFELELAGLAALVADFEKIGRGIPPEHLAGDAPILDRWIGAQRAIPCLVGLSSGHPILSGEARPITTSDLWLLSKDRRWARTMSRWYRLGHPGGSSWRAS